MEQKDKFHSQYVSDTCKRIKRMEIDPLFNKWGLKDTPCYYNTYPSDQGQKRVGYPLKNQKPFNIKISIT